MRGTSLRASLAVGICLLAAPSAGATPPGLHVDPDSPGGKEYAIPLDQARDNATGGGGGGSHSSDGSGSQLFGAGIGSGSDSGGSGGSGDSGGSSPSSSGRSGGSNDGAGSQSDKPAPSSGAHSRLSTLDVAAANPQAGAQAPLLVLGGSAGIVFAGVLLGLMLRRRRSSASTSA
jgi:hypothetical protein